MQHNSPRFGIMLLLLAVLAFSSCVKENPKGNTAAKGVYLVNEGNFNFGNAEISFYDPATNNVNNNLFNTVNGYGLGDVAQSLTIHDSIGFIVVNNSAKIEVVSLPGLHKIRTITISGSSPRYLLPVNDSIAYVSDLYAAKIHVVNYQTGMLVKQITGVPGWTEHLVMYGADVWVEGRNYSSAHAASTSLVKLNTTNHTLVQTYVLTGSNCNGIVLDKSNNLWVAVEQDTAHGVSSSLICYNQSMQQIKKLDFAFGQHPSNLCINGAKDKVYYLDKGVYSMDVTSASLPDQAFIAEEGRTLYGLGIDPGNGEVYLSDALDYVQPSIIFRYNALGELQNTFHAGIITGNFSFKN